ncbi:MAG: glucan biosynthesis protein G [bacterium]|nr:glucan biosynthesis protein G [bacterium]
MTVIVSVAPLPVIADEKNQGNFDFASVEQLAQELSRQDYRPPVKIKGAENLSYDDYRMIRFRPNKALWRGNSLFEMHFFHTGFLFQNPVNVFVIENGIAKEVRYSRDMFDVAPQVSKKLPSDANNNFAGIKFVYPLHKADTKDDVAVFLGASYFRMLGRGDHFGLSARGLAIDTAEPEGEEFPSFSKFWIIKPGENDSFLTLFALLESPSISGAYRFTIRPAQQTTIDVSATLYPRNTSKKIGIAPLTSMYLRGEADLRSSDDFRPEVHDSDALLMHTGSAGEWLFRPLIHRHDGVRITRFLDIDPRGFGLIQRDRLYDNYLDLETHSEERPDFWIKPLNKWGAGSVELVEIPSNFETNDNIVAYWVANEPLQSPFNLAYRITAGRGFVNSGLAEVKRTMIQTVDASQFGGDNETTEARRYLLDFSSDELRSLGDDQPVHPEISLSSGRFQNLTIEKNRTGGEWRVTFVAIREKNTTTDMRLSLNLHGTKLSETWLYLWDE